MRWGRNFQAGRGEAQWSRVPHHCVIPAHAGIQSLGADKHPNRRARVFRSRPAPYDPWMPACAGMTTLGVTWGQQ